jgi:signal transduction histidine kinase/CheY-like chemotaxis protein
MFRWPPPLVFDEPETTRQANLIYRLVLVMGGLSVLAALASLLEPKNDFQITITFYGSCISWFALIAFVLRKGYVQLATWALVGCYWGLIAYVTLVLGGLQGQNASNFAVCTLLAGILLGFRYAIGMAALSSAWAGLVAYLEVHQRLPPQLGAYSPANAWGAVTVTVFLTTALLQVSTERLRRMHDAAERSAEERDEALRRSILGQKMELVGTLTSGVAHDLNNLLTVITSVSSALHTQVQEHDQETKSLLGELEAATSRAALMTTQLLSFGRSPTQHTEVVNLSSTIERSSELLSRLVGPSTAYSVNIEPDVLIVASRTGIEQILLNLAVNARDAMPSGGKLSLRIAREGDSALFEVADTGLGMSEEVKDRVFEPFFTTKSSGTGLGLATVRQLMDHFAGRIEIDSRPGSGTRFRLYFPLAPTVGPSGPPPDSPPRWSSNGSRGVVLLVEDDILVQKAMTRMLESEGFTVLVAGDGEAGLRLVHETPSLRCIVSDIVMPKMDGEALANELSQTHPNLPLLLMSGNRQVRPETLAGLPRAFLQKPVNEGALRRTLRDLLDAPRKVDGS